MKKLTRLLCLGAIALFVLGGPAIAGATIYTFTHPAGNPWAILEAFDPVNNGATYTYEYTLRNVGLEGQAIHRLLLQIGDPNATFTFFEYGSGDSLIYDPAVTPPPIISNNIYFMWADLAPGEITKHFGFTVALAPGTGTAVVWNTSLFDQEFVSSAIVSYDGQAGTDPVPEPATLLLLGSGLLGAAVAKRFKRSRKS